MSRCCPALIFWSVDFPIVGPMFGQKYWTCLCVHIWSTGISRHVIHIACRVIWARECKGRSCDISCYCAWTISRYNWCSYIKQSAVIVGYLSAWQSIFVVIVVVVVIIIISSSSSSIVQQTTVRGHRHQLFLIYAMSNLSLLPHFPPFLAFFLSLLFSLFCFCSYKSGYGVWKLHDRLLRPAKNINVIWKVTKSAQSKCSWNRLAVGMQASERFSCTFWGWNVP